MRGKAHRLAREPFAEQAAQEWRRDARQQREEVVDDADLAGHLMLASQRRGKAVLRGIAEQRRHGDEECSAEQRAVTRRDRSEGSVNEERDRPEQRDVAPVAHAEGMPGVAQQADEKR